MTIKNSMKTANMSLEEARMAKEDFDEPFYI